MDPKMRLEEPICASKGEYDETFWKAPGNGSISKASLIDEAQKLYPNIPFAYLHQYMDVKEGYGSNS